MTTKLQHSINPLTRAPHNIFAVNPFIFHHCYQESQLGLHIVVSPMDRTSESRNVESMRKMILMQEQVFKQQVQELHHLYNRQKKLMHEIENGLTRRIRPTETGQSFQVFSSRDDQKAPSSSNSGESSKMPIKFDLEMPAENAPSSSHPFEEQKDLKKIDEETDVEVELTLSIGRCTSKRRSKSHFNLHHCNTQLQDSDQSNEVQELGSTSTKTNKGEEYGEPSSIVNSSSVCQENTRPHWLMQDLSLNRT